jgi:hypothetical protein
MVNHERRLSAKASHAPQLQCGVVPPPEMPFQQPNPAGILTFGGGCAMLSPTLRMVA